ncbi:spore germination protein PF [Paenibacillus sp. V4I3]|uniref:spore germination protein n=1 Tax=unclassified Paenibacillus TaxID=185978 RepID=UPI00278A67BB|nr:MULTISPECIES: spore germination protein [unclassified Paenibacillus]MDQ0873818.1 spore germination protein PF [Paenibacillus sp. V4I3]MDQ0890317.1 spore germination protein PF [Paenibacillus sp. V4I9]
MPSFIGIFNIIRNEGSLVNGDTCVIAPTSASKSYAGSGGAITGDFGVSNTLFSATITFDPDGIEAGANKTASGT